MLSSIIERRSDIPSHCHYFQDLFFQYSLNNFLHTQVEQCVTVILNNPAVESDGSHHVHPLLHQVRLAIDSNVFCRCVSVSVLWLDVCFCCCCYIKLFVLPFWDVGLGFVHCGGGGVDPIPCVSTHRISDPRSGPAQLLPPHVKQRSYPHGVRPQIHILCALSAMLSI